MPTTYGNPKALAMIAAWKVAPPLSLTMARIPARCR